MAKKRADGYIQRQVTLSDGTRKVFYAKTPRELNRKIADYKEEQARGRTFAVIAELWEADHFPTLEYNTLKGYRPALARAVEQFGRKLCKGITPKEISLFIQRFAAKGYAQKTVRTQLLVLHLVFDYAVLQGDIDYNPAAAVRVPKGLAHSRREAPSEAEIEKVKAGINCTFGLFAFLILSTGLRRGEALALHSSDILWDRRLIRVSKSVYHENNRPMLKTPKTEAGERLVPLLDDLAAMLPRRKGLLFPNEAGELLTETQFQRQWELYCRESGVTVTPHQLRHAYATILFEVGLSDKDAQELLGHANIQTTRDVYTHISEQRFAESAAKISTSGKLTLLPQKPREWHRKSV